MGIKIKTDRLLLLPFSSEDLKLFLSLNKDSYIRKFIWDDQLIDHATAQEVISRNEQHFEEEQFGLWKIQLKETQEIGRLCRTVVYAVLQS